MSRDKQKEKYDQLNVDGAFYNTEVPETFKNRKPYAPLNQKELVAAIPGTILDIFVKEGDEVEADEKVLILEAMKMRNIITHAIDGKVKKIHVKSGDIVTKNQLLMEFE
jgi:biotin carboxyl carrier protein